jgi:hypothetical protein
MKFNIASQVPIFALTQRQLNQLVEIASKRGDQSSPIAIVASLIDRELRKETSK